MTTFAPKNAVHVARLTALVMPIPYGKVQRLPVPQLRPLRPKLPRAQVVTGSGLSDP